MTFDANTLGILTGASAVTALVPAAKIYFGTAPANEQIPFIVCYEISNTPTLSTDNGQPGSSQLDNIRLQVSSWGRTNKDSNSIAKAIRRALEAARPTVYIFQNQRGAYEDEIDGNGKIQEYSCWHPDEIPA